MTTTAKTEILLAPESGKTSMFPVEFMDIWKMYKTSLDCFWRAEEVDLSKDLNDWNNKLSKDERFFISSVLAFFSNSESTVISNLVTRFMKEIQPSEAKAFYSCQLLMETIHSEMYSLLIETYISDSEEKHRLLNGVQYYPAIEKKDAWARKWITDNRASFAMRLIAFAVVEGIFFSSSFASIYWIKKRGLLPGLTLSNEFIARDEAMHCEFAVLLYSKIAKKLSKKKVHEIIEEAVAIEKEFICESLPCRLIGMNHELMSQYVEFVADRLCIQLGYDRIYQSTNPFNFMDLISIQPKTNFFEVTNSQYALANKTIDQDTFVFNNDF